VATQALTEDDLEKIGDQVKEVTDEAFQCDAKTRGDTHICAGEDSFIASTFGSNQDSTREKDRGRTDGEYNKDYRSKTDDLSPIRSINRARMIKISPGAIEFPSTEMQEKAQALSHIDLVLSQLSMNVLKGLQTSVTQGDKFVHRVDDDGVDQSDK
jgi:methionine synthase II (cobalamin-independent)